MAYVVKIEKQVLKTLEKTNEPVKSTLKNAIHRLAENPRPFGYIKLTSREAYRIRVGNYRVIYEILDNVLHINIIEIGNRRDIYKQF